jgi:hypothetical protein
VDFLTFLKLSFREKTNDLDFPDRNLNNDRVKVRKSILKFISVFHPDKQASEDKEFYTLAEEITKHLNMYLKHY